ncbi:LCP family protein [Streptomyces gamaensis]|uniref:LCP family protein n=1 Tax=Streptomyces gamaensis TaxID=1763542 RepID=A0ABW0Z6X1_9ACTN
MRRRAGAGPSRATVVARAAAVTVCSLSLMGAGVSWYAYHELETGATTSDALSSIQKNAPAKLDNSVNLLLIGLDSRKDMDGKDLPPEVVRDELHAGASSDVGGYNTNSLILIHIPAGGKAKAQAVSIPRDDYVMTYNGDGSQQGMHKIKEAYGRAKSAAEPALKAKGLSDAELERQSREAGRKATLVTVQKFLDVHIDHFAEVNLIGFYDVAKAIGPIDVCLKRATKDPAMKGQGSGADFHKGINTLSTPSQALAFVRQRHNLNDPDGTGNSGDFARTHRQQAFITSAMIALKKKGIIGNLGKMQSLLDVVKKDIVIDNRWNLLDFAQQAPNLTGGNVVFNTLPVKALSDVNIPGEGKQSVNEVDVAQVRKTVRTLFTQESQPDPKPSASSPAPSRTPDAKPSPSSSSSPRLTFQGPEVDGGDIPCVD